MTEFPEPQVGLVISYSYLWSEEAERGQIEGRKDRPCAIIVALEYAISETAHRKQVAVFPSHILRHVISQALSKFHLVLKLTWDWTASGPGSSWMT